MHVGGVYTAMLNKDLATHSGGTYFVRIEDTDQAREIEGAKEHVAAAFAHFGVEPLEDDRNGAYGPYLQSQRADTYLTYIRHLLRTDRAYLCFASREELAAATAEPCWWKTVRVMTYGSGSWTRRLPSGHGASRSTSHQPRSLSTTPAWSDGHRPVAGSRSPTSLPVS
jgi:hypothetical protein